MDGRKLFRKTDLIIVCTVTIIAALCYFLARQTEPAAVCNVLYDGEIVKTVRLDEDAIFKIDEAPLMEFEIKSGEVAAVISDCPDKVCVRTGYISHTGQKIVCLPNRVVVEVKAAQSGVDEPDMIAR